MISAVLLAAVNGGNRQTTAHIPFRLFVSEVKTCIHNRGALDGRGPFPPDKKIFRSNPDGLPESVLKPAECRIGADFLSGKAIGRRNPGGFQVQSMQSRRKKMLQGGVLTVFKQTQGLATHAASPDDFIQAAQLKIGKHRFSTVHRQSRRRVSLPN